MALRLNREILKELPKGSTLFCLITIISPPVLDDFDKYYFDDLSWFLLLIPCFIFSYFLGFAGGLYTAFIVNIYHMAWYFIGRYIHSEGILREAFPLHVGVAIITFLCSIGVGILSGKLKKQYGQLQEMNEKLKYIALYDPLTDIPNRTYFMKILTETLKNKDLKQVTLMFIDLDGFKKVNDSYGHEEGDKLLKVVAERLKIYKNDSNFVCRLGGDEFVILINQTNKENLLNQARSVLNTLQLKFKEATISASIGIAFLQNGDTPSSFLNHADMAMYQAKSRGKNTICFYN